MSKIWQAELPKLMRQNHPAYLRPGQTMRLATAGLGEQQQITELE